MADATRRVAGGCYGAVAAVAVVAFEQERAVFESRRTRARYYLWWNVVR